MKKLKGKITLKRTKSRMKTMTKMDFVIVQRDMDGNGLLKRKSSHHSSRLVRHTKMKTLRCDTSFN